MEEYFYCTKKLHFHAGTQSHKGSIYSRCCWPLSNSILPRTLVVMMKESLVLLHPFRSSDNIHRCSQDKWDKCFSMPWVWLIFTNVQVMTKLCGQGLVEEYIKDNKPPGQRKTPKNQAQWDVDQQLSKVMRAWHQLEPSTHGQFVRQCLHFSCRMWQKKNINSDPNITDLCHYSH